MEQLEKQPAVTLRAVVLGACLIPLSIMWLIQSEIVWYTGQPVTISLFYHVIFILLIVTAINLLVKKIAPAAALNAGELLTIYVMLCISNAIAGHDMLEILVPTMSHAFWFATPENRWAELGQYLPPWLTVRDLEVLKGAYEGNSTMYSLKVIKAWGVPMLWWGSFVFALVLAIIFLNIIFRKQWTEFERLSYPVIQIPLELTTNTSALFRNKLLWIGLAISGTIDLINGLAFLYPSLPAIPIIHILNLRDYMTRPPWNAAGDWVVSLYPFAVGLCFFLPLDLSFSCWFFYIFWKFERIIASAMGIRALPGFPFILEQGSGAYIGLGILALWISRRYLKQVFLKIIGRSSELDDAQEAIPYKGAFLGLIACIGYMLLFSRRGGMPVLLGLAFFMIYFLISIAIARMRAELGPPAHDLHYSGPDMILVRTLGSQNISPHALGIMSMFWFFNRAYRAHPMAHTLEGFKIAERTHLSNKRLFASMIVATFLGIFFAFWTHLYIFYKHGMSAQIRGPATLFGFEPTVHLSDWIRNPQPPNIPGTIATILGIGQVLFLAAMRLKFVWWPFHPVGFAISSSWSMDQLWAAMMLSWAIKWAILRYGGARAYRPAIPFFVGLVLGEFAVGSFWNLLGIITGKMTYHFWPW